MTRDSTQAGQTAATEYSRPQLNDAAVLTIVATAPPQGSFRPPYCGSDKTPRWNQANLNYSILKRLPSVTGSQHPSVVEASFLRPWIEIDTQYTGRESHPKNNQPMYGRDLAILLGTGLLTLHLDYSEADKRTLYTRIVQIGIDIYGAAMTGGVWEANGGHNLGRKMPMLLAGLALNDPNILKFADRAQHNIFQEDHQTWYVEESDVGRAVNDQTSIGRPREQYTSEMVGLPEWGIEHFLNKWNDGSNWGVIYRDVCYPAFTMHALAAHLTSGARERWNWQVFFDYVDRAYAISDPVNYGTFTKSMWNSYRSMGGPIWSRSNAIQPSTTSAPNNARILISTPN